MPKKTIDYSNTFFYRIVCKDINIPDCYVGHTTNIIDRRRCHKKSCNSETDKRYNCYVYQFIRANCGWDNWDLLEIERKECIDVEDARKQERFLIEYYGATLNCYIPSRTRQEWKEENKKELTEKNKLYREKNKIKIAGMGKQYRDDNNEEIKIKKKQFYDLNREKILQQKKQYTIDTKKHKTEYNKQYREKNIKDLTEKTKLYREQNREKLFKKYDCECGGKYIYKTKSQHFKTKKHIAYTENNQTTKEII